ncbi:MAG: quinol:electron acceptor oxidoreductase subunit ActD, partial [Gammaproteobacteria bacterium]
SVATAVTFILPTSGRPIITIPPYLIISYEMTILFGVLFTLLGFHVVSGLPAWRDKIYRPASNVDRFTLIVECAEGENSKLAENIILEFGAEEVSRVEGDR